MTDAAAIYNYVPINDSIASSGQPQREQFQAIKAQVLMWCLFRPDKSANLLNEAQFIMQFA